MERKATTKEEKAALKQKKKDEARKFKKRKKAEKKRNKSGFNEKEFLLTLSNIRNANEQNTELDLSHHHLDALAAEDLAAVLAANNTLTRLNLSHNQIGDDGVEHLAKVFERNKTLQSLDISFNGLTRKGVYYLTTTLNNNVFITELHIEEEVIELDNLGLKCAQLAAITLESQQKLQQILEENKGFQKLLAGQSDRLDLQGRKQQRLNTILLERFPSLRMINLSRNKLTMIPTEIGTLKQLQELNLSQNKINVLPNEIGDLGSLEVLVLDRNQLSGLPSSFSNLTSLRRLDLADNLFNNIPWRLLSALPQLESLELRGNRLKDLLATFPALHEEIPKGGVATQQCLRVAVEKEKIPTE